MADQGKLSGRGSKSLKPTSQEMQAFIEENWQTDLGTEGVKTDKASITGNRQLIRLNKTT